MESDLWFHWAPTDRRNRIKKEGLVPGRWSRDRLWKPPYVCLTHAPGLAWSLSGEMDRGRQIVSWDLWEVSVHEQTGYEELFFDTGASEEKIIKEIRVYERIFKRNVWYVATREVNK